MAEQFEELLKRAESGDAEAQYAVSCAYYNGNGIERDVIKSAEWVKRSAEQGYLSAMYDYGWQLSNGAGVEQDFYEAAKWYKKAADRGHAGAQNNLGVCFAYGNGVDQSYEEAAKYYAMAADGGDEVALSNLAGYYFNGTGVKQDYSKAYELYKKSAEKGYKDAEVGLARCYEKCADVRDPKKAFELYTKAAEDGDAIAMYNLAQCYYTGTGTQANPQKALEWYEKSALEDYLPAQIKTANIYWDKKQYSSAVKFYDYARYNGDDYAQYSFAFAMYYGQGIREDKSTALYILENLAKKGEKSAADMLAGLRSRGIETDHNKLSSQLLHSNSYLYFDRIQRSNSELQKKHKEYETLFTCKSDDPQTVFECGEDYFYGRNGKTAHHSKALMQYKKAAGMGHAVSMFKAGLCFGDSYESKKEATEWFKKAADAGYRGAFKYLYGIDAYLKRAAELDDGDACLKMGEKSLKEGDEKGAVKWFAKGYSAGNVKCLTNLRSGRGKEFRAYRESEAEKGDVSAQYVFAEELALEGKRDEAREWYKKAAEQGYGPACEKMADGCAVKSDGRLEWLLKSKDCYPRLAYSIATEYRIRNDFKKAAEYYEKALEGYGKSSLGMLRFVETAQFLSDYYYEGIGVEQDYARALKLKIDIVETVPDKYMYDYELKMPNGAKEKQYYIIGHCYHCGLGCEMNYEKAEEYFKKLPQPAFYSHFDEMKELRSHKCGGCGKYVYEPVEKRSLFNKVKKCCPFCGKQLKA